LGPVAPLYRFKTDAEAINEGIISIEIAPFGGMKESGIGPNLASYWGSKYGIEEFLEVK
jgi:acyl-CoA reductase-like NAD-dependent aldehyde dehydrogenase